MIEQGGRWMGRTQGTAQIARVSWGSQGRLAPEQKRRRSLELTESEPGT
jgi:hypothetical protein